MEQQLVSESIIVSGYDSRDTKSSPIGTSDCSSISGIGCIISQKWVTMTREN